LCSTEESHTGLKQHEGEEMLIELQHEGEEMLIELPFALKPLLQL